MADYKDKLDEWREAARRKARELDEKYKIKDRVEEGARAAEAAARKGAARVAEEAERARAEAERLSEEFEVREHADEVRGHARRAAGEAQRMAREAGERAGEVFGEAKKQYGRAARVVDKGARVTRLTTATTAGAVRAHDWAREHPKQVVIVSFSLAPGAAAGPAFPRPHAVPLGA